MLPSKRPCAGDGILTNKEFRERTFYQSATKPGPSQSQARAAQPKALTPETSQLQGNYPLCKGKVNTEGRFLASFGSDPVDDDALLEATSARSRSTGGDQTFPTCTVQNENVIPTSTTIYCFGMVVPLSMKTK
jgi:hypothetical protein